MKRLSLLTQILTLLVTPQLVYAADVPPVPVNPQETPQTCGGSWQSLAAKVPGSTITLILSIDKEGHKLLQWSPHTDFVTKNIHKARGSANAKGEIAMCSLGDRVTTFTNVHTSTLQDLKESQKLQPGYYAISVVVWSDEADSSTITGRKGNTSDWVAIQIE